ncbi:uncharacterized protein LOC108035988 isoform X2 [Drosophila biarmipes]|uniref:uncharacterized protein LOC108035988 isoform X2 n=1 Tax=Drosophila biarmipes TaxID=125945 RepID=UPI0021CCE77B|nr:uncharacterized protein LOC108035988 isoform X2 [Drosophila biarmipes]
MSSSMEKAKHFFDESGILGHINFKDSRDLIRKTSTIHIDISLKNQIRKTSLCLRSRVVNETNALNSFDDTILSLQNEVYNIRETLDNGETKIITLRTEIGKIKTHKINPKTTKHARNGEASPPRKASVSSALRPPRSLASV